MSVTQILIDKYAFPDRKVFGIKSGRVVIFGSAISLQSDVDAKLERKSRDFQGWIDEIARESCRLQTYSSINIPFRIERFLESNQAELSY